MKVIKRALISVADKSGIEDLGKVLSMLGVEIMATGSTADALKAVGIPVILVEDYTGHAEMLGGRVKTLHPLIYGGILAVRGNHDEDIEKYGLKVIDLVIVNFYHFAECLSAGGSIEQLIEKIDIGGPSLVRASAKNFAEVCVLTDPSDYSSVYSGSVSLDFRKAMARKAFNLTFKYDRVISEWLGDDVITVVGESYYRNMECRYGENPHQKGCFYGTLPFDQLQGKELSYNNLLDIDSAVNLVREFKEPACVIVKHNDPCGVALGSDLCDAYARALSCDAISSFGGIVAFNGVLDAVLAEALLGLFLEVVISTSITAEARKILSTKRNLRVLIWNNEDLGLGGKWEIRSVLDGVAVQERNLHTDYSIDFVTTKKPDSVALRDLDFAWKVCKHVRSNAIVVASDTKILGIGGGQTNRIASVKLACERSVAGDNKVLASDAFFPFPDSIKLAAEYGIESIIQPGGSIKDTEVIKEAEDLGIAMVFTKIRNFKH